MHVWGHTLKPHAWCVLATPSSPGKTAAMLDDGNGLLLSFLPDIVLFLHGIGIRCTRQWVWWWKETSVEECTPCHALVFGNILTLTGPSAPSNIVFLLRDKLPLFHVLYISPFEVVDSVAARLAAALLDDGYDVRTIWSINHPLFEACCDTRVVCFGALPSTVSYIHRLLVRRACIHCEWVVLSVTLLTRWGVHHTLLNGFPLH